MTDKSETNPEIEQQLDALAEICCDVLDGEESVLSDRSEALLKSLLMSGFVRKNGPNLQAELEARVKDRCREPSMHRGGALSGITQQLQRKFDQMTRWESKTPTDKTPPKGANISSATDA